MMREVFLFQYKNSPSVVQHIKRQGAGSRVEPFQRLGEVCTPDSLDVVCSVYEAYRSIVQQCQEAGSGSCSLHAFPRRFCTHTHTHAHTPIPAVHSFDACSAEKQVMVVCVCVCSFNALARRLCTHTPILAASAVACLFLCCCCCWQDCSASSLQPVLCPERHAHVQRSLKE